MPLTKLYDAAVKTGEYTDRNGQTKGRWENVGSVMRADDGNQFLMLKKTFNPAGVEGKPGSDSVLISFFDPKPRDQQRPADNYQAPSPNLDDEIPF